MKMLLAVSVLALAFAGAAEAQSVTATLKTPLPKPRRLALDTTVWDCKESECRALVAGTETPSWQACRTLVRITGPVASYANLDAAQLARCNGEAPAK